MLRTIFAVTLLASTSALQVRSTIRAMHVAAVPVTAVRARTFASETSLEDEIKSTIASDKVVVYCKSTCPFCDLTAELFDGMDQPFTKILLDKMDNGPEVQATLATMTGQRTVPNVFINGKHLGGNDDTQGAARSGKLQEMLAQ